MYNFKFKSNTKKQNWAAAVHASIRAKYYFFCSIFSTVSLRLDIHIYHQHQYHGLSTWKSYFKFSINGTTQQQQNKRKSPIKFMLSFLRLRIEAFNLWINEMQFVFIAWRPIVCTNSVDCVSYSFAHCFSLPSLSFSGVSARIQMAIYLEIDKQKTAQI